MVARFGYVLLTMRDARPRQTITFAACGSRRRRAVHISHSSLAGFQHRSLPAAQLQDETRVLPFCSSHWNHKRPKNNFPIFTQDLCQHVRIVRSAVLRGGWFQNVDGITRLKAPSTCLRDVRSALIILGTPIKPS